MMVDLYLDHHVRCISAAGYLRLTWPLVFFRLRGIHRGTMEPSSAPTALSEKFHAWKRPGGFYPRLP
jgi:hypothetical protein